MENRFKCSYTKLERLEDVLKLQNPKNNNVHSEEQIDRLSKIIDFQKQRSPIIISKRSDLITKGHARLLAMQKLGWDEVAVDYQEYSSEHEEYLDMTADNEIARWSSLNVNKFLDDMKALDLGDIELFGMKQLPALTFDIDMAPIKKELDPTDHWQGMPEFTEKDKTSFRFVIVHFDSQEHFDEFFKLIGQTATDKTKSIWHPKQITMDTEAKRYE